MSEYEVGDEVVIKWKTRLVDSSTGCLCTNRGTLGLDIFNRALGVDMEVVSHNKPVRTFKPGDRVKDRYTSGEYLIVQDGFVRLPSYEFIRSNMVFTTRHYELVEDQ